MILFITPSARRLECAAAIEAATSHVTRVAETLHEAASRLRSEEYSAVVIDQSLLESDPDGGELVVQHLGSALPVYVNCAISSTDRVVRELRSALQRRQREALAFRKAAEEVLRNELREPLTALLLDCELALTVPSLPYSAELKLRAVQALARDMQSRLQFAQPAAPKK